MPSTTAAPRDLAAVHGAQAPRAQLRERGPQVLDVRALVAADEADQIGRLLRRRRELRIREQRLAPGEGAHREDLDDQHLDHGRDQRLERLVDLREEPLPLPVAPAAPHHPHQHVARDARLLEREIARRLPHLLVAALVAVAGLVARVRLEERPAQMRERGARERLADQRVEIGHLDVADDRAEALDDRDDRERAHDRIAHALAQQQPGLREIRVLRRHQRARHLDQLRPLAREPRLPGSDRRPPVADARRAVGAVRSKPPWQRTPPATSGAWQASLSSSSSLL